MYVGCQPKKIDDALEVVITELNKIADKGLTGEELTKGKGGVRGSTVLALEDTFSRMSRLGKGEVSDRPYLSTDEILAKIDAVTADDVAQTARDLLTGPRTAAVIGPFEPDRTFRL